MQYTLTMTCGVITAQCFIRYFTADIQWQVQWRVL
jgi:hypothetical protein